MARVDFYVLREAGQAARDVFACKLAEKAYRLDNTVHIHVDDASAMRDLDELLWTFRDGSFVPHHCVGGEALDSPVTIGCDSSGGTRGLLINLSSELPAFAADFERVAEVVSADDVSKQISRERYSEYREQGHSLETHKL
ncbi:MAG: DNA polymerase III subunit chi [Pseudomonadota bacterium]